MGPLIHAGVQVDSQLPNVHPFLVGHTELWSFCAGCGYFSEPKGVLLNPQPQTWAWTLRLSLNVLPGQRTISLPSQVTCYFPAFIFLWLRGDDWLRAAVDVHAAVVMRYMQIFMKYVICMYTMACSMDAVHAEFTVINECQEIQYQRVTSLSNHTFALRPALHKTWISLATVWQAWVWHGQHTVCIEVILTEQVLPARKENATEQDMLWCYTGE